MGDFEGKRWRPYLDEEARERRDEILDHLEGNYDGPSDFIKQKLMQETALGIDERIERAKSEEEEAKEKRKRLERIRKEREEQSALRDKKELLKEKQKKLSKLKSSNSTQSEVYREVIDEVLDKKNASRYSEIEWIKMKSKRIQQRVDRRLSDTNDVDELVSEVERLQGEIRELNNGEELNCFLDLEVEEVRSS